MESPKPNAFANRVTDKTTPDQKMKQMHSFDIVFRKSACKYIVHDYEIQIIEEMQIWRLLLFYYLNNKQQRINLNGEKYIHLYLDGAIF